MPTRAKQPCPAQGCKELIARGGQCPLHPRQDSRPSPSARGYGSAWQRIRAQVLEEEPFCRSGCGQPSTDVDHIIPKPAGTDARGNLQGLCHRHHSQKTAKRDGGFGR